MSTMHSATVASNSASDFNHNPNNDQPSNNNLIASSGSNNLSLSSPSDTPPPSNNDDSRFDNFGTSSSSLPPDHPWRFSHLLPSTTVPTDHELRALLSARAEYEQTLKGLQGEINELQRRIGRAQAQVDAVQGHIDRHSSLASPLRRIPPEILRDIFSHTIPLVHTSVRNMCLDAPWTLLRVCRHWHDICLFYGSLWSRISVDASLSYPPELPRPATAPGLPLLHERPLYMRPRIPTDIEARSTELLQLKLERSQDADLFITIQARSPTDYAQPFLSIIWPHLHRCVYIKAPRHILMNTPLFRPCERLKHIDVDYSTGPGRFHSGPAIFHQPFPTEARQEVEAFQAFLIGGNQEPPTIGISYYDSIVHPVSISPPQSFPASRLTKINIIVRSMMPTDIFLPDLCVFINLTELSLIDRSPLHAPSNPSNPGGTPPPRGVLPRLEYLAVSGIRLAELTIGKIIAPRLIALAYIGSLDPGSEILRNFMASTRIL